MKSTKLRIGTVVIALQFTRGPSLVNELGMVDDYLIFPFAWIPALWGVSRWKKRTSVQ